jgi:DNA-binding response OmpR family regulator
MNQAPLPKRQGLRILVIEDDEVDRMRVMRMLQRLPEGLERIDVAEDKAAGAKAMRSERYDCVLLDYRLPDGEGIDLLDEMNASEADVPPIIIETVLDDEGTALRSLAKGAQDYLVKGRFDADGLRRSIRYAVERGRLRRERNLLVQELQEAMKRVRTLEGLLKACCYCHRVRDDDDQWLPIERFVQRHSQAKFSHGICPECLIAHEHELNPDKLG